MKIDHIGIACSDLRVAEKQYTELGYKVTQGLVSDETRNLDYVFMENNGVIIELVGVMDKSKPTDIDNILKNVKMLGNKMYHTCYLTRKINKDIKKLENLGYTLLKPPRPAIACGNRNIAFLIHFSLGLIELLEEEQNGKYLY